MISIEEKQMVLNCANALAKSCMDLDADSAEVTIIKNGKVIKVALTVDVEDINAQSKGELIMPKILCASIDCKWNGENEECTYREDKPIKLNDCHIHTLNEGFKHFHYCTAFEESEEAAEIRIKLESDLKYAH